MPVVQWRDPTRQEIEGLREHFAGPHHPGKVIYLNRREWEIARRLQMSPTSGGAEAPGMEPTLKSESDMLYEHVERLVQANTELEHLNNSIRPGHVDPPVPSSGLVTPDKPPIPDQITMKMAHLNKDLMGQLSNLNKNIIQLRAIIGMEE